MKPIIFCAEMVQAIQDDRKTQTRRVIEPQPSAGVRKSPFAKSGFEDGHGREIKPRYYPGDILWVRETWQEGSLLKSTEENFDKYIYKADDIKNKLWWVKWRPSIHMPREAARLFLKVMNVRVDKLQNITEEGAIKEGCVPVVCTNCNGFGCSDCAGSGNKEPALLEFNYLWDNLNAKRGYGWDKNPWMRVIEFERIEKPC